jgi:DNA-binding HxlR family transcriptional regulator
MVNCARLYPLQILSRKWSYLVLRALSQPLGFSELQKELKFITNHILTRELKLLQEEKLIVRKEKYTLTPAGHALYEALEPLVAWSVQYAGAPPCPSSRKCSACLSYPAVIGARSYIQIGKKH